MSDSDSDRTDRLNGNGRFPPWIRKRLPSAELMEPVRLTLKELKLATVCQSAQCPNIGECFCRGTATFMILGDVCTRSCRFCAVKKGAPAALQEDEPFRVAEAVRRMGLKHVVVTSVTRDDLPDGGAGQFRRTIEALRKVGGVIVEVLTPDFGGNRANILTVALAKPDVFNHNIETVRRLYGQVRPEADYERSLGVIALVKREVPDVKTKSGLMLGLGETREETISALEDLRRAGCDIVTLGQYLRPSAAHAPIARFLLPEEFDELGAEARRLGFSAAASGPFVRSSYHAEHVFQEAGS
ncbi:MAG TPA: lipoyl synthase [Candidatus Brocadiia bacterium]|nr:lipoyl synthase [Candidatus Brocadiia bacterium]